MFHAKMRLLDLNHQVCVGHSDFNLYPIKVKVVGESTHFHALRFEDHNCGSTAHKSFAKGR